ncbi:hypothetical protein GPECTOR_9g697 [Gonium pectorale]|uniref:Ion transport domain-containing protein n=1 Tax=Gonium pectorale TaxID=33097 RepID=A0A150GSG3_GONPE|nr:hypothetical protein GPECTOR_9g697 [Gonium pectorale]|eukprot:KXZ52652.1 hypothetical protein GPECTOR_9g697 [Gonium pectorale]
MLQGPNTENQADLYKDVRMLISCDRVFGDLAGYHKVRKAVFNLMTSMLEGSAGSNIANTCLHDLNFKSIDSQIGRLCSELRRLQDGGERGVLSSTARAAAASAGPGSSGKAVTKALRKEDCELELLLLCGFLLKLRAMCSEEDLNQNQQLGVLQVLWGLFNGYNGVDHLCKELASSEAWRKSTKERINQALSADSRNVPAIKAAQLVDVMQWLAAIGEWRNTLLVSTWCLAVVGLAYQWLAAIGEWRNTLLVSTWCLAVVGLAYQALVKDASWDRGDSLHSRFANWRVGLLGGVILLQCVFTLLLFVSFASTDLVKQAGYDLPPLLDKLYGCLEQLFNRGALRMRRLAGILLLAGVIATGVFMSLRGVLAAGSVLVLGSWGVGLVLLTLAVATGAVLVFGAVLVAATLLKWFFMLLLFISLVGFDLVKPLRQRDSSRHPMLAWLFKGLPCLLWGLSSGLTWLVFCLSWLVSRPTLLFAYFKRLTHKLLEGYRHTRKLLEGRIGHPVRSRCPDTALATGPAADSPSSKRGVKNDGGEEKVDGPSANGSDGRGDGSSSNDGSNGGSSGWGGSSSSTCPGSMPCVGRPPVDQQRGYKGVARLIFFSVLRWLWYPHFYHFSALLAASLLAFFDSPFWLAMHFSIYFLRFRSGKLLVRAIWRSGFNILSTFVLMVLAIYIFAIATFLLFQSPLPDDAAEEHVNLTTTFTISSPILPTDNPLSIVAYTGATNASAPAAPPCATFYQCLGSHMFAGIKGDIRELFGSTAVPEAVDEKQKLQARTLFILAFFMMWSFVLNNIFTGTISSAFESIREEENTIATDVQSKCLVCSAEAHALDEKGGLEKHMESEHNLLHYVFFLHHLETTDSQYYNGAESYVYKLVYERPPESAMATSRGSWLPVTSSTEQAKGDN